MLLADVNIHRVIVERLRQDGHALSWMAEGASSSSDMDVLRLACEANAILITEDRDFGELVFRDRWPHSGVLLVRLPGTPAHIKAEIISRTLREYEGMLRGSFGVLNRTYLRIRAPRREAT